MGQTSGAFPVRLIFLSNEQESKAYGRCGSATDAGLTVHKKTFPLANRLRCAYLPATASRGPMTFENGTKRHDDHVARAQEGGKPALIRDCGAVEAYPGQA